MIIGRTLYLSSHPHVQVVVPVLLVFREQKISLSSIQKHDPDHQIQSSISSSLCTGYNQDKRDIADIKQDRFDVRKLSCYVYRYMQKQINQYLILTEKNYIYSLNIVETNGYTE